MEWRRHVYLIVGSRGWKGGVVGLVDQQKWGSERVGATHSSKRLRESRSVRGSLNYNIRVELDILVVYTTTTAWTCEKSNGQIEIHVCSLL